MIFMLTIISCMRSTCTYLHNGTNTYMASRLTWSEGNGAGNLRSMHGGVRVGARGSCLAPRPVITIESVTERIKEIFWDKS